MKWNFYLIGVFASVTLVMAAPRMWTFRTGVTVTGDYVSSGTTKVVIRRSGTNFILNLSDLSTNDRAYVAQRQLQARLGAETNQFLEEGMIELSAKLIENSPEKVNWTRGWMDVEFSGFSSFDDPLDAGEDDYELMLSVKDSSGDLYSRVEVIKLLSNGPNPVAELAATLRQGDKIRLIGTAHNPVGEYSSFEVEKIQVIEKAAER